MSEAAGGVADLRPLGRAREQRAWYWYDWANSAFVTTTAAVLFAPLPHLRRRARRLRQAHGRMTSPAGSI